MDMPNCEKCYHYGVCHYKDNTLPVCGLYIERDKVAIALQAEKELKSAMSLIKILENILSGYSRAATNMCAYHAYKKIKDWQSKHIE